jgi:CDP-glucose 4,6-dehydratase
MGNDALSQLNSLEGPILITGHTGFKGTWMSLLLNELGVKTFGMSLAPEPSSLYFRCRQEGFIPEVFGDIRDRAFVEKAIGEIAPSAIIHMAAQPLVLTSYQAPLKTFETNVLGTANVLNAAFQTSTVRAVAVVTTDKVYKNTNDGKRFAEDDPLEGKDPYSASKVGTETVVAAWQQIGSLGPSPAVLSLRAGNVIGGGDFAEDRLLPDIVRAKISKNPIKIRNLNSSRPWQHVLDPLWGYLLALDYVLAGESVKAINFGPENSSLRVSEVLQVVSRKWNIEVEAENSNFSRESISLDLDSKLSTEILNWKPLFTQEVAILETLNWWEHVLEGTTTARAQSQKEIKYFLSKVAN